MSTIEQVTSMKTLLLLFSGPQQSWGISSKFNDRDTERFPTYSGVLGLIACAMGIERDDEEALSELAKLMMSVRIDQPGDIRNDWQVAHTQRVDVDKDAKLNSAVHRVVSNLDKDATYAAQRAYLSDAKFVVGLTGDEELIDRVASALRRPKWQPYLGRKAFVPDAPLFLDVAEGDDVISIFKKVPWQASGRYIKNHEIDSVVLWIDGRLSVDEQPVASLIRKDMPVTFSPRHRRYLSHAIDEHLIPVECISEDARSKTRHDPLEVLREYEIITTNEKE